MSLVTCTGTVDARDVAKRIKAWLDAKGFESRAFQSGSTFTVKARKASGFRAFVGADRALEICVRHQGAETQVEVRQGSWKTNAVSNVAWLVATGGTNLLISGWSVLIQKELEQFVRTVLEEASGSTEVDLSSANQPAERLPLARGNVPPNSGQQAELPRIAGNKYAGSDSPENIAAYGFGKRLSTPHLWNALAWVIGLAFVTVGIAALVGGQWKGAGVITLGGLLLLPLVRRLIERGSGIAMRGGRAAAYSLICVIVASLGNNIVIQQRAAHEAAKENARLFDVRQVTEMKRAAIDAEFGRDKLEILERAQRILQSGDYVGARAALAKYQQISDPDLIRLRDEVSLAALRIKLIDATTENQRGVIYSEISRLDPADPVARSKAADYHALAAQPAVPSTPTQGSANEAWSTGRCFNFGESIAKAYFANISGAVQSGVLASEMMDRACKQEIASQGPECASQCNEGFRLVAKQWVKNGAP